MSKHAHFGHRSRMKSRFLKTGFDSFEPHEVLEFILFYAIPKRDTNKLAHELLEMFGSVAGVLNAPYELLIQVSGIGDHAAILLKHIPQLFRIYAEDMSKSSEIMDNPKKWSEYFKAKFIGRTTETLFVAGIDDCAYFVACEKISTGTRQAIDVSCESLFRFTIRWNIDRIVLAHNHPNGIAVPSLADKIKTQKLETALKFLDVTLVDHFIFGKNGESVSMKEYYI